MEFTREENKLSGDCKSNVGRGLEMFEMYVGQYLGEMVMRV